VEFNELIKMEPSRKRPKVSDIFVVQPKEKLYYFGKVILTQIKSKDSFINGMNLIYIYNSPQKELIIPEDLELNKLIIPPTVVNNRGWLEGYFKTIGVRSVSEDDLKVDYGFKDIIRVNEFYCDVEGKKLEHKPKYCSIFGLGSYGVVGRQIQKILEGNYETEGI